MDDFDKETEIRNKIGNNLIMRRKHWEESLKEISELAYKHLVEDSPKTDIKDGERVSRWAFLFSDWPMTKQDAHWQVQSYLMMEILQELKEIKNLLSNGKSKEPSQKLARRKAEL